jgi:hypothetical protein
VIAVTATPTGTTAQLKLVNLRSHSLCHCLFPGLTATKTRKLAHAGNCKSMRHGRVLALSRSLAGVAERLARKKEDGGYQQLQRNRRKLAAQENEQHEQKEL